MSASRVARVALFIMLAMGAALPGGCSSHPATKKPNSAPVSRMSSLSSASNTGGSKVVDDHIVTYSQGDLTGLLPPAKPVQIIHRGNPDLKRVAITIDDGWNPDMRILTLLKDWKIRFTAFVIGGRGVAETHPDFVRAIQEGGGEVCNHTYSHYVMTNQTEAFEKGDIMHCQDILTHVTHEMYPYVRFSGGAYGPNTALWAAQEGFWTIDWTIDSLDTRAGITSDVQVNTILKNLEPGAILLFHWAGYHTYEVMARVIPEIQKRGYEVTSLSGVLQGTPYGLHSTAAHAGTQ